jgi:elongation factor Ts
VDRKAPQAAVSAGQVKELRSRTGAGVIDCRDALIEAAGDLEKAAQLLRAKGLAAAERKSGRVAREGLVTSYIHGEGRLGVLVEVNCETDFVAKGADFRRLAKELALQIAGYEPRWISRQDVPDEVLVEERNVYQAKAEADGKPPQVIPKMVEGQIESFLKQNCLLEQPYFREPKHTVQDIISEHISKLQENITVRRFARFNIREA